MGGKVNIEKRLELVKKLNSMVDSFADKWHPIYLIAREHQGYKDVRSKDKEEFKSFIRELILDLTNPGIDIIDSGQIHVGILKEDGHLFPYISLNFMECDYE